MLIHSLLQREVPSGKLPADVGVVVNNVGTLAMLGELLPQRAGLIGRVVTVSGPGVRQAGNYLIPQLGTRIGDVLRHAGMESGEMEVILGGPMMGMSAPSLDIPVTKRACPASWCFRSARCPNATASRASAAASASMPVRWG